MSFDEQPDPLSDYMEAFDKMKLRAENSERLAATAAEQLATLRTRLPAEPEGKHRAIPLEMCCKKCGGGWMSANVFDSCVCPPSPGKGDPR